MDARHMLEIDVSKPGVLTLLAWGVQPDVGTTLAAVAASWLSLDCARAGRCSRTLSTDSGLGEPPARPTVEGQACCLPK